MPESKVPRKRNFLGRVLPAPGDMLSAMDAIDLLRQFARSQSQAAMNRAGKRTHSTAA
jgi:hypothetical protein